MNEIPFDDALELLSNQYRRDILKLITIKERYAFELSKILNISQRAVSNHLKSLQETGIITSEKRKSSKGPDREYFNLNRAVVLSITVAPNLYLATLRSLDENIGQMPITPELQLGSPQETGVHKVISEGLQLLPQITEGLELLEVQQSKLLRGYQGLRNHLREIFERENFNTKEIRLLLHLIEHEGEMTKQEIDFVMDDQSESITSIANQLKARDIINIEYFENEKGEMSFKLILTVD